MTILNALANYGFVPTSTNKNGMWIGEGCIMWGKIIEVFPKEAKYLVRVHKWLYNCEGDEVYNTITEQLLFPSEAFALAYSERL